MELNSLLNIIMIVALFGFLICGFPVAFTLAGTAILFAGIGAWLGLFDLALLGALPSRIYGAFQFLGAFDSPPDILSKTRRQFGVDMPLSEDAAQRVVVLFRAIHKNLSLCQYGLIRPGT